MILIGSCFQAQPTRQRRQAILPQYSQRPLLPALLKITTQPHLPLLLNLHQRIRARLANQLLLRATLTPNFQQTNDIALSHEREDRVRASRVALPVWVVGDIACGDGDGVDEGEGLVGSWGRVAELWVQGDAVGACGIDG
jgi:hypothetical protein